MTGDDFTPPTASKLDGLHTATRSGLSAIPVVGGAVAELFATVMQSPLDARRQAWQQKVGEELAKLNRNGVSIEELQGNAQFISVVATASQIAIRTHQEEKLSALRAAISNVAVGSDLDEDIQFLFLNLVEEFTPRHLAILNFFRSPEPSTNISMGALSHLIEQNFPELAGKREYYDQLWRDLHGRGLVNTSGLHTMMSSQGLRAKRTTLLGDDFLNFINTSEENPE